MDDPITDPDEAAEAGYFGYKIDPTPNEEYTVTGSGSTPETDASAKEAATKAHAELRERLTAKEKPERARTPTTPTTPRSAPTSGRKTGGSST